jgi:hypothetical protein
LLFLRLARVFLSFNINLILLKLKVVRHVTSVWRRVTICAIWSMYETCYGVHTSPSMITLKRCGCPLHSGPTHVDSRVMVGLQLTFFFSFHFFLFYFMSNFTFIIWIYFLFYFDPYSLYCWLFYFESFFFNCIPHIWLNSFF